MRFSIYKLIVLLVIGTNLFAARIPAILFPNYPYKKFSVDEGLPQSIVSSIIQDAYGFIWLSTNEGIARFNGSDFKVYNEENGYPFRLVTGVVENKPGEIWVATYVNGLWRIRNSQVEAINLPETTGNLRLNSLTKTSEGEILLIADPGGLYVFKNDSLVEHIFNDRQTFPSPMLTAAKDFRGRYWIGTFRDGIRVIQSGRIVSSIDTTDGLPSPEIRAILPLRKDEIWIGTPRGLYIRGNKTFTAKFNALFPEASISNIYTKNGKDIWISLASEPGGTVHVRDNRIIEIIRPYSGFLTKCSFIDRSGALFIGSYNGLVIIPNRNFQNFATESGIATPYIKAIYRDKNGRLLVATKNDGLYRLRNNRFQKIKSLESILKKKNIHDLATIGGDLWIGTTDGLIIVRNGKPIENNLTRVFQNTMVRRFIPEQGKWFILTSEGIFELKGSRLGEITHNLKNQYISFWGIATDKMGRLCLGTNGKGMYQLYDSTWIPLKTSLPVQKIFALRKDEENNLYLATSTGLYQWDGFKLLPVIILKHTVWDVLPSPHSGVWLLTSKGLYRYYRERLWVYNKKTGLATTEFNMGALLLDRDGSLWFGGVEGLVHFTNRVNYDENIPWLYITDIEAADTLISYPFPPEITFPFRQNNLKIHFTEIAYSNAANLTQAYFLKGFDQDTSSAQGLTFLNYTNLSDGDYTFYLFLKNPVDDTIVSQRTLHFRILKPWWKSIWFIFLFSSLLFSIVYLSFRAREAYHRRKTLILEKLVEERTKDIKVGYLLLKKETEERKKIQLSLDKEREELEVTLKSIADGIVRTDQEGRILLLNRAAEKLIGIQSDKAVGKILNDVLDLESEDQREKIKIPQDIQRVLKKSGDRAYFNAIIKNKQLARDIVVSISWAKISDPQARESGYVWVIRDISTERQLENEIIKMQKLESIGLLAGGIAHDFNNILSGILGNAQLARLRYTRGEKIDKYLAGIEEAAKNAAYLTQQLLTFAKGGEPVKEELSLKDLLRDGVEFALRGSNIALDIQIEEDLWGILADPGQINQVINNLVINAVQAMPEGGKLTIRAENCHLCEAGLSEQALPHLEGRHFVKLIFRDTGIGIMPQNLSRIFDPYFTTKQKGSGLGLATTYAIIKKHGGQIMVESEPGKGTTFTIILPAIDQSIQEKKCEEQTVPLEGKPRRVLVMDDEDYILELFQDFLEMLNFEVETALDGEEAIRKYQQSLNGSQRFDLIIMDLTIRGGMGGKEAAGKILEIDSEAKIIVSSGYSTDSVLANFEKFGFAGRIIKPFSFTTLSQVITQVLGNSGK